MVPSIIDGIHYMWVYIEMYVPPTRLYSNHGYSLHYSLKLRSEHFLGFPMYPTIIIQIQSVLCSYDVAINVSILEVPGCAYITLLDTVLSFGQSFILLLFVKLKNNRWFFVTRYIRTGAVASSRLFHR